MFTSRLATARLKLRMLWIGRSNPGSKGKRNNAEYTMQPKTEYTVQPNAESLQSDNVA